MCLENAISISGHVGKLPKPDSGNIWISVRYEKLQNFCYSCGKIGHDNRDCDDEKLRSSPNSSEPRFGAWLATTVCRSWDDALNRAFATKKEEESGSSDLTEDLFSIKPANPGPKTRRGDQGKDGDSGRLREEGTMGSDLNVLLGDRCRQSGLNISKPSLNTTEGVANSGLNKEEELEAGLIKETDRTSSPVVSTPTQVHVENPLALVPFCGKEMNAMIDSLGNLGLKRSAAEDWESVNPKKRGVNMGNLNPIADISTFARDLRKVKVRIRRGTRKRRGWQGEHSYGGGTIG
ncbi:hypothetical protein K1719_046732 [Acacia pycnantha]|nr:hypothetical protein K1719_046732 [Acacia pycnantha]